MTNALKTNTVKDRLLAKQCINRNNMTCITWEPQPSLIRDIEDGSVHQRYQTRLQTEK